MWGKFTVVLFSNVGTFLDRIGESDFTSESDSLEVIDEPDESTEIVKLHYQVDNY